MNKNMTHNLSLIVNDSLLMSFDMTLNFQTTWPKEIEAVFNMYRVGVFFWILAGLVWLGGVISIITELIRMRGHNMSGDETKKCSVINSEKDCFLR